MATDDAPAAAPLPWRRRRARPRAGAEFLSPAVRRLAAEGDVDPAPIAGRGTGGRITRADILDATRRDTVVPFSPARRTTARRLLESKHAAAHAHVAVECDYTRADRARREAGLTYLPFVARAVVDALREFPQCNATVAEGAITRHEHVNLGIAVDLEHEELVVPVVANADALRVRALASAIADVAARARDGKLRPDDVSGGTFTITNPGPFGTIVSAPVINHPQVAILATDAVRRRLTVVTTADGDDALAVRPVGVLSLGFDGAAVDLESAAGFVTRVRDILEHHHWHAEL
jgi:2-oxoglutarate dehydrogenase E2 component (dihydrolipoamide succinyltransferase)